MRKETTQPPEHPSTNYTDLFVRDYFIYLGDKNTLFFLTPHILVIEKLKKKMGGKSYLVLRLLAGLTNDGK